MLKLVLIALEILKRIQQSRGTIKVSLTYQSQCSSITYHNVFQHDGGMIIEVQSFTNFILHQPKMTFRTHKDHIRTYFPCHHV